MPGQQHSGRTHSSSSKGCGVANKQVLGLLRHFPLLSLFPSCHCGVFNLAPQGEPLRKWKPSWALCGKTRLGCSPCLVSPTCLVICASI